MLALPNIGSRVGPQVPMLSARGMYMGPKTCYCVSGLAFRNFEYDLGFPREIGIFHEKLGALCFIGFFVKYFIRELWLKEKKNFCVWFND